MGIAFIAQGIFKHMIAGFKTYQVWLRRALILALSVWAVLSLANGGARTLGLDGGWDLHVYWYHNHFILDGVDPYQAFFDSTPLDYPVTYWVGAPWTDGDIHMRFPVDTQLSMPALTAPLLLVMTPLSLLSWEWVQVVWLAIQLAGGVLTVWVALRLLEHTGIRFQGHNRLLFALAFLGLFTTRIVLRSGQTTFFVLSLMLLAVLLAEEDRAWWGGVALGIALSKYSVAAPVVLYMLYRRKLKTLVGAALVQVAGALLLAAIAGVSPLQIIADYLRVVFSISGQVGIYIAGQLMEASPELAGLMSALFSLIVVGVFAWLWSMQGGRPSGTVCHAHVYMLGVLLLWSLLGTYHRQYDMVMAIVPLALLFGVGHENAVTPPRLGMRVQWALRIAFWGTWALLSLPASQVAARLLPAHLSYLVDDMFLDAQTYALLALLVVMVLLARRVLEQRRQVVVGLPQPAAAD